MIVSLPPPPQIESAWLLPVILSAPLVPLMVMLSVPLVQFENVQAAAEKFVASLMTMDWVPAAPVTANEFEIKPAPNWAALERCAGSAGCIVERQALRNYETRSSRWL